MKPVVLTRLARARHHVTGAFRLLVAICLASAGAVAQARPQVHPYLEIGQVVTADLEPQGPALTYSQAILGVDVTQKGVRSEAQLSYRYERIIGWGRAKGQQSRHIGFARASANIVANLLDLEVGALATQVRNSLDGPSPSLLPVDRKQLSQLYSTYAGAQLRRSLGPLATRARYYVGYTHADVRQSGGSPADVRFGSALTQDAIASVGMAPMSFWAAIDGIVSTWVKSGFVRPFPRCFALLYSAHWARSTPRRMVRPFG